MHFNGFQLKNWVFKNFQHLLRTKKLLLDIIKGNKMRKIILTIILSSFLPALATAEDKKMQNSNPNPTASLMSGKHMMNSNPNASIMEGKHMMMSDDPFSSHPKGNSGTSEKVKKGYTVIKYKE